MTHLHPLLAASRLYASDVSRRQCSKSPEVVDAGYMVHVHVPVIDDC